MILLIVDGHGCAGAVADAIVGRPMDALDALRATFGFANFRPGQQAVVSAACRSRDALVVMPTGAGKSLCYQLPALIRRDLTVVVSPLVSLMQDQARALERVAPGRVAIVNGQRDPAGNARALARAGAGEASVLYVAPERFASAGFWRAMEGATVGLFAVDEAHCLSHWGHDFRPDYLALADAARALRARATIALTATATPVVVQDIAARLALREPLQVMTGFDRPNLTFSVVPCRTWEEKVRQVSATLLAPDALPAIVYAGTRSASEELAVHLADALRTDTLTYHAGLARDARALTQERFMAGDAQVIVATNAFGMGVDKPDVRTVCHACVPASLETYYQEAGRAGRDGHPAHCQLLFEPRDKGRHVFFIERSHVHAGAFAQVVERLRWAGLGGGYDIGVSELVAYAGAHADDDTVRSIASHLARAGVLLPVPAPASRLVGEVAGGDDDDGIARCVAWTREAQRARWERYRAMWDYIEQGQCRRETLLAHFGDHQGLRDLERRRGDERWRCCDVCDRASGRGREAVMSAAGRSP